MICLAPTSVKSASAFTNTHQYRAKPGKGMPVCRFCDRFVRSHAYHVPTTSDEAFPKVTDGIEDLGPQNVDAEALQKELSTHPDVRAARVVSTASGRLSEIHLVADGSKSAKQLVRDVQTLALAKFGIRIDYRIVSVVHFGEDPIPAASVSRPVLASVTWSTDGTRASCTVEVDDERGPSKGHSAGSASSTARGRLAAQATADALQDLIGAQSTLDVADVSAVDVGGRRAVVVVLVRLVGSSEELLLGAALVRNDESEAVARAVLDAYNRQISPE